MRKVSLLSIMFLILLIGCQSQPEDSSVDEGQEEKQEQSSDEGVNESEELASDEPNSAAVITVEELQEIWGNGETTFETQAPLVGVGDETRAFIDYFGEPDDGAGGFYIFLNEYMHVLENTVNDVGRIVGVSLDFEKTDQPQRTIDETLEEIAAFIPLDAKEIDSYELPSGHGLEYYYESDYVAKVFEDSWHIYEIENRGGFSVQAFFDPNSNDQFNSVVMTVGYKEEPEGE
ncbi:hypothetical protein [Bacillus sp. JCM 19034]|uniref:hypothetical protein n=1 Tax=Bacillus sp. JCM 19034 TaxID=1481928 RepID=UPI0012E1A36F|nr:hypothetical protein [Bacillus sp. JCM 19034]